MPYIGKSPVGGGFHKLDNLTASATATYALTLGSAAYFPETANQLLVSLNGVIQAPQDSFTVSGSNLVFDSALTASDSIDFVVALGDVLGVGTPTDGTITTAKIANNAVTMDKLATSGTLPALDGSNLTNVSAGKVLQVIQTVDTTPVSASTSAGWNDLGSLSVAITPSATTSKIMIECHIGQFDHSNNTHIFYLKYVRGSTDIGIGDAAGSRIRATTSVRGDVSGDGNGNTPIIMPKFLDSPSTTSATTYKVQFNNFNAGAYYYLRSSGDTDGGAHGRFIATLTATEIAG